jgi:MYXO-CTERM domain-containing protein
VPGWQYEFEKDSGLIKAITWSGGKIKPEEFQEFAFQAKTPKDTGEFAWKAYQTYEDGSVVEWTGPPDAEEPASVVRIASGKTDEQGTEMTGMHSEGTAGSSRATLPESGGPTAQEIAAYAGPGLGALLLAVVALLALHRRRSP